MKVSAQELAEGRLNLETVALAVQLIRVNGYVLCEEVLPREQVWELFDPTYDRLSGKAKSLFRNEKIGFPVESAH